MPPTLALVVWFVLLMGLLYWDPAKELKSSIALWVPLIWMFILGSRLPSQWLGNNLTAASQAFEEGNPLDRTIFFVLIMMAVGILVSRSFNWGYFVSCNLFLVALISFGLVSILWSDFPFVGFKRWVRDLGHYLTVLVVLSDAHPLEAVRTLLRRFCYLLIPLNILIVKYYPQIGRTYDAWTGAQMLIGATMGKNMLGVLCLVSGIFLCWDTFTRWPDRRERRTKQILLVNLAFIVMTLWLLKLSKSATSSVCLVIGCLVILAAYSKFAKRHPGLLKLLIPASFCLYVILAFGFDLNGNFAGMVGRNPSLTDRTLIWKIVLGAHTDPVLGTGYESFWLGPRLNYVWKSLGGINEAHNGYLEVYLSLGLIGLFLLVGFLLASYRSIWSRWAAAPQLTTLNLSLWATVIFYNITESAFKFHLMWFTFLLAAVAVPRPAENFYPVQSLAKKSTAPKYAPNPLKQPVFRDQDATYRRHNELNSGNKSWISARPHEHRSD
jgi:exopolysaccharide production protein ExoQ